MAELGFAKLMGNALGGDKVGGLGDGKPRLN
jgi:hypothetical protein